MPRLKFTSSFPQACISLLILFVVLGEQVGIWPSQVLQRLEWLTYDERVLATLSDAKDPSIVIVDIDEESLQAIGQWPWPRAQVAQLLFTLFEDYNIQFAGLDVIFAEPETNLLEQQWQELYQAYPGLPESPPFPSGDDLLRQVIAAYPVVPSFYFDTGQASQVTPSSGVLPRPLTVTNSETDWQQLPIYQPRRYTSNAFTVQPAPSVGGFFDNPMVDSDGVFRRVPLVQRWHEQLYPSLPLAMFYTLLGQPPVTLDAVPAAGMLHLEGIDVGGFYFPTDPHTAVLVPWAGKREHFPYISAAHVLEGRVQPESLEGKIVLLGTSAPGLMDLRSTSVGAVFPGVEIHANVLAGMLQMSFRSEPGYSLAITVLTLFVLGLLMTWLYPRLRAVQLIGLSLFLLGTIVTGNMYAWHQGLVLPIASVILLTALMTVWHLTLNFWRESHAKKQVADQFGMYIPPELVKDIVASPEAQDMAGQEKELTVLFSDIRGFTTFSEKIPPAELTQVMNRLLTPVTQAIHAHQGTIDKYMGDAVMAFWGAPLSDEKHALHAVEGALAMQEALTEINREFVQEGKQALAMGVGIHTGLMNVGNMGSSFRMAYTVLGDNVNLGARLESLTKNYGVDILISEITQQKIAPTGLFLLRKVDKVRVKGRFAPVEIFQLLGKKEQLNEQVQAMVASFENALSIYEQANFAEALQAFQQHLGLYPDDQVAQLYLIRCENYLSTPPPDNWDGVFTHKEK
ncbi:adenylate/guanylate cyclase domain-containing protein [Aliidiomarina taiwanensis]|uniref:Adenylate/guanylate cyclase domain-containing protein n=1 Tax=Aliidiomarina taiwanensis TaxID=946228 RepID=A0A432X012_9GAMM|nr:adenylate/guanylate cyclase domain-containing protein [Aliidiomarina taiwanensis]RUO39360.1 adenylate/guanylate cyclase domain-containing protein [Aliidiomarina taiwanensis]